ncbi:Rossmann-like and DUF2520 domain-containing protein [Jatrophihabitans lederbergiae]|uniref:DUF2520 domain-containing protein n=1 Tax=Jatrophihabitans lederbergiae TaxID=3075547 RepID=A0ABU2J7E3_9ACTN|nr:DUF2520 domain-containing protein [Jatrophihabitans sp. DSM 44399]MDT0260913.1 DUF2520 domain-containing protein [Jatrophihabitans sp. DSM 44399]
MIEHSDAPRLRVAVIGVGRVGSVMGAALRRAGHLIVAGSGVSDESTRRAARLLPGVSLVPADEAVGQADLVLLTVPDDQLSSLIDGLAATGAWQPGQLAVHTSGAHGIAIFAPAAATGVVGMALHPVMTFAGRSEDLLRLDGAAFGVTAPPEFRPVAETLVLELGGEPVWVPESARAAYHAALSMGSNHLVTLVNDSSDVLRASGVEDPVRLLGPLLNASLDNALRLGDEALTGPVSRGDRATIEAHLAALHGTPFLQPYLAMALRTMQRAHAAGRLSREQCAELIEGIERAGGTDT